MCSHFPYLIITRLPQKNNLLWSLYYLFNFLNNFYFQFSASQLTNLTDRQIILLNQMNQIDSWWKFGCGAGFEKEFVITEAWTHSPWRGAAYRWSELSVIPLSFSDSPCTTYLIKMGIAYCRTSGFTWMPPTPEAPSSVRSIGRSWTGSNWLTPSTSIPINGLIWSFTNFA